MCRIRYLDTLFSVRQHAARVRASENQFPLSLSASMKGWRSQKCLLGTKLSSLVLCIFLVEAFSGLAQPGTKLREFTTGNSVLSGPAIGADGTVYVGSHDHNVYAFNPDGTTNWVFATGNNVLSSPAIAPDGTICVGSQDGSLYSIRPDGTTNWVFTVGGTVNSSPAIGADGTIYFGNWNGHFYAVNPDGTKQWEFVQPGQRVNECSPAIAQDCTL